MSSEKLPRSVVGAFAAIASKYPANVAVAHHFTDDWVEFTYSQLLEQAASVATQLHRLGVKKGDAVVLPAVRGGNLCSQLLGILWVGAHYVYIDPEYPPERQEFICRETGAGIGLFDDDVKPIENLPLEWHRLEAVEPDPPEMVCDENLTAYVMFTSGSTGTPKGVVIPHLGIYRLVCDTDFIDFDEQVFLQLSALGFDASTLEIWGPLLNGGTCVLHPENGVITPAKLKESIESRGVTTLWLTSSLYNLIASEHLDSLVSLSQLLVGGEALSVSHVRLGLENLPGTRMFNGYGPTENTTFSTIYPIPGDLPADTKRIPIGFPIHGTECDIFDEDLKPTSDPCGTGELLVFGEGLALGYLNRPDLTAERFIEIECRDGKLRRGYRTGDLVQKNHDGSYEYLQRNDKQVKIDGHRIEPGEIELYLNELDDIADARVVVRTGPRDQKRLTAYFVGKNPIDRHRLRETLSRVFPRYMVPHFIIPMDSLPINQNGKLDESRLPDPFADSGEDRVTVERSGVAGHWSDILERKVGYDENFLDAGGTSLEAVLLTERLEEAYQVKLGATFVFEYPTINSQTRFLEGQLQNQGERRAPDAVEDAYDTRYAVIGMACRFPGADNLDEYWQNLLDGRETVNFFGDDEISEEVDPRDRNHPNYVKAKGIIDRCDEFDAEFFGITPTEAKLMDPQQRLMLQLAWNALEDAAIPPGDEQYRTGIFVGMNWARYFQQYVLPNKELLDNFGQFNAALANETDFLSTRISYKLNLTGPSVNVFTACSTGLVAIAQACASIEQRQCEIAIAGGVSVSTPVRSGYIYQEGGMLSRDGHCRPFDAEATGTTFNDGAGLVVLKRLDLAERDGDRIYATVRGYAVNNDGEAKASYTAPSVGGQVAVYQAAIENAGIPPESVGFIETHGTATPLGDPIEVEALARIYGNDLDREGECVLGSVKSNIGHTIHAAGAASFIKTVLAVRNNQIPGTLFFKQPNPKLDLKKSGFHVNSETEEWKLCGLRRAAVSSLGVGGTNAHIIVEDYPQNHCETEDRPDAYGYPVLLSAKSAEALKLEIEEYRRFFENKGDSLSLRDVSYTSIAGRRQFSHRAVISGPTASAMASGIAENSNIVRGSVDSDIDGKIGFLFTGQGSQREDMGSWLYRNDAEYRQMFDAGSELVLAQEGIDIRDVVFADSPVPGQINQTQIVQPALLLLEYGLARILQNRGCNPDFLIGHSIGEYTAAILAGVMSFEDAVRIVARRGALMQSMPPGRMLVVKNRSREEVAGFLSGEICLAASNAPSLVVLAGPTGDIEQLQRDMEEQGIESTLLETSHAFHSHMMEPIVGDFEKHIASFELAAPAMPIFSTSSGKLLSAEDAGSPGYWASQVRNPVLFSDAVASARASFGDAPLAFVEVGPGQTLTSLVAMQSAPEDGPAVSVLPNFGRDETAAGEIQNSLGSLWVSGFEIDWSKAFSGKPANKISIPGYAFKRDSYWLPAPAAGTVVAAPQTEIIQPAFQAPIQEQQVNPEQHLQAVQQQIKELIEDITGYDLGDLDPETSFTEAGLDSLLLTQVATALDRKFSLGITFRHLVEEYTSLAELGEHMAEKIPPETTNVEVASAAAAPAVAAANPGAPAPLAGASTGNALQDLINAQLQIMQLQLQAFGGGGTAGTPMPAAAPAAAAPAAPAPAKTEDSAAAGDSAKSKPKHTPGTRITREKVGVKLTSAQQQWVDSVLQSYQTKFAGSKAYTQKYRKHLADPRTVSGFNPEWKEIIFPIVTERSRGSKLWDIDGNELIDTSNGFGPIFFGHSPEFVTSAIKEQLDKGIETGPQSPLAGEVADLFCELTGYDRCTFASTGSEAVIGALRIARTVTGRSKVAMFEGSYHGIFDEVINRPGRDYQALPAAPGIPREATSNMIILPWGEKESLDVIRELGPDLAAVLVESVQSRMPEFHDRDYLNSIREITRESDTAMILDEVVTGFRVHAGGIRKYFDIDADIGTYGKVVGGGYPIGIIGGKSKFMDALDGGSWQYGDDSIPECGVTFFAGTFVRHPLALVAAKAIMEKIRSEGEGLYRDLEKKTADLAAEAKRFIEEMKCAVKFEEFSSFFYVSVPANAHWGHLLFTMMTLEGIHIQQYRPNFLTTEHSEADVDRILTAFKKSLAQMVMHGLIEGNSLAANKFLQDKPAIPAGAKLGKNAQGEPAYFVEDPKNKGKFLEVGNP
jgi:amino acid adenylation domain-containing protein